MEEKKLEEKILAYRLIEARINSLINQRSILISSLNEIESTLESLEEFEGSEEIYFPLSSGVYCLGKIVNKEKVIVSIGANVALEKSLEEAKDFLNRRKEEIEKALEQIENEILNLQLNLKVLEKEIKGEKDVQNSKEKT